MPSHMCVYKRYTFRSSTPFCKRKVTCNTFIYSIIRNFLNLVPAFPMVPFPLVNLKTGGLFMNMEIPDIRAELADEFETANKSTGPRTPEGKQRSSQNALERLLERKIRLLMDLQELRILYGAPPPPFNPRPTPTRDPALSRGEGVARDGAFTGRRRSGEGSLHCHTHPAQNTNNSRNELHDLLQSKALTTNDPSKRTGMFAPNEPLVGTNQRVDPALSLGERVGHDGVFSSRRGSGEGSLHCCPHPSQNTENSGNELHDLLQSRDLANNVYTKRTVSEAPNELLGGIHESDGPARPIPEPTPHPSCSGWRKRRSPTPSPLGRGLLLRVGGSPQRWV